MAHHDRWQIGEATTIVILPVHRRSLGVRSIEYFTRFPEHIPERCLTVLLPCLVDCLGSSVLRPPSSPVVYGMLVTGGTQQRCCAGLTYTAEGPFSSPVDC